MHLSKPKKLIQYRKSIVSLIQCTVYKLVLSKIYISLDFAPPLKL